MDIERIRELAAEADLLKLETERLLPRLADARRNYASTRSEEARAILDAIQDQASQAHAKFSATVARMNEASGIPPEVLEELTAYRPVPGPDRTPRQTLTSDLVPSTFEIDDHLGLALETLRSQLPPGWLDEEPAELADISPLYVSDGILSLTKGIRPESEFSKIHRLRQAIRVSEHYLAISPAYDQFAGALLVPAVVRFGLLHDALKEVGGDLTTRLRRLWTGASGDVDSTMMELFTAATCASRGRRVEFIEETTDKSPDLRCHDPFPLVIECKRQRPLSQYEIAEEAVMRDLFARLRIEARKRRVWGRFSLVLTVEAKHLNVQEVVTQLVGQRFAPRPDREQIYEWGRTAFIERPWRIYLPAETRPYSPHLLERVFGWTTDLPKWDGLCCSIDNAREPWIDATEGALGLVWNNISEPAMRKKTWAPAALFGAAAGQVPRGEFGIVYIAYNEGARPEVADARVEAYKARLHEWEHSSDIQIPISFLSRLYPRPLKHGAPDLIESSVRLCSDLYGQPLLFEEFPGTVFTQSEPGA